MPRSSASCHRLWNHSQQQVSVEGIALTEQSLHRHGYKRVSVLERCPIAMKQDWHAELLPIWLIQHRVLVQLGVVHVVASPPSAELVDAKQLVEVLLWVPSISMHRGVQGCWAVAWESGPSWLCALTVSSELPCSIAMLQKFVTAIRNVFNSFALQFFCT